MLKQTMLDQAPEIDIKTTDTTDDAIYCAACGHLLTRTRWAISMDGHERVFINPAGRVFRIRCFSEAPGTSHLGDLTTDHSWFPSHAWDFAICGGCDNHVGWRYVGESAPQVFYGLMKTALTGTPTNGQP